MKAVEHDEKHSATYRKANNTLGTEAVRFDQAALEGPDRILLLLVSTIERGEIKV